MRCFVIALAVAVATLLPAESPGQVTSRALTDIPVQASPFELSVPTGRRSNPSEPHTLTALLYLLVPGALLMLRKTTRKELARRVVVTMEEQTPTHPYPTAVVNLPEAQLGRSRRIG